jgi:hypothetical protein
MVGGVETASFRQYLAWALVELDTVEIFDLG